MYREKKQEYWFIAGEAVKGILLLIVSAYLFFDSPLGIIPLLPYACYLVYKTAKKAGRRQRNILTVQFKDVLAALSSALEAGDGIERAVSSARADMVVMYGGDSYMVRELSAMEEGLAVGKTIEEVVSEFAAGTHVKEIENFADVFVIAKRSGGNLMRLVRSASSDLYEKTELKREIEGVVQSTVTECSVMKLMPPAILLYMRICAGSFLAVLYDTPAGRLVMCLTVFVYLLMSEYAEHLVRAALEEEL